MSRSRRYPRREDLCATEHARRLPPSGFGLPGLVRAKRQVGGRYVAWVRGAFSGNAKTTVDSQQARLPVRFRSAPANQGNFASKVVIASAVLSRSGSVASGVVGAGRHTPCLA